MKFLIMALSLLIANSALAAEGYISNVSLRIEGDKTSAKVSDFATTSKKNAGEFPAYLLLDACK